MTPTSSSVDVDVDVNLITPEDVLESLMNDGTIDAIRLKIVNELKANEELKNNTISMVEQSKVLNTPGAEKQTKRELFDALRQELETPALERASKSVWELILDKDGLGKEINETVQRVFCRLSGHQPPLFPPSDSHLQHDQVKEIGTCWKEKEGDHLDSPSKKRSFRKMSPQIEQVEVAQASLHPPSLSLDSVSDTRTAGAHSRNSIGEEEWRCKRSDGKNWRCPNERLPDLSYCERHSYLIGKKRKESQFRGSAKGTHKSGLDQGRKKRKESPIRDTTVKGSTHKSRLSLNKGEKKQKTQAENSKQGTPPCDDNTNTNDNKDDDDNVDITISTQSQLVGSGNPSPPRRGISSKRDTRERDPSP